jgi:hypothetical protein
LTSRSEHGISELHARRVAGIEYGKRPRLRSPAEEAEYGRIRQREDVMIRLIVCMFCLALLLFGCGRETQEAAIEKKIEEASGGDAEVDISDEGMKITGKTEEGEYSMTAGEEAEIPDNFPDDVFIYKPSKAVMAMKAPEGHSITLSTDHDIKKVTEAYKKEMEGRGWVEEATATMGERSMLVYKKGDKVTNVTISPSDKGVQISIMTGTE